MAPRLHYVVDENDCITHVSDEWASFAAANGAPELAANRVIGQSLWTFVAGESTRRLYRVALTVVRSSGRVVELPFRCDSPLYRRQLRMRIARGGVGTVVMSTITESLEPWDLSAPEGDPAPAKVKVICSMCKATQVDGAWEAFDDYVMRLGPQRVFDLPYAYELCESCESPDVAG